MKTLVLFFGLSIVLYSNAQLTDTTCIKSRWLAVKNNKQNHPLFQYNLENIDESLLGQVKYFAEKNLLNIYSTRYNFNERQSWYAIPDVERHIDLYQNDTIITSKEDYFSISVQSDVPEVDENGEPMVTMSEDGTLYYLYPQAVVYEFTMKDIVEIRIKETRLDPQNSSENFEISGFSFCHNFNGIITELFWIDAIEFKRLLTSDHYFWYNFLFKNQYTGFQFMQTSCYE